ncbi:hypothetical protein [Lacticaseibacillus paracasei]|uniref:hypothetical protein n=1 Tax=Lacticaseibacillus paracasei TaxID=1597 RepID=UPI003CFD0AB3
MLPLAVSLVLILIAAYFLNNREIMSPAVLFSGSFAFSGVWALAYAQKWFLEPSPLTVIVLVGAGIEFVLVTFFIHLFFRFTRAKQTRSVGRTGQVESFTHSSIKKESIP